jgi:predicted O-linked N-acetylglucosamine transferase (SPINDLY family)/glycosyltransferase involved in cell wall biosynthesis
MKVSALEAAERAVALQPDDAGLWYRLGIVHLDSGLLAESEFCWRKVLTLDPQHAKASVNLGLVLQVAGKDDEALQCYRDAVAADPVLAQAWFNLGALLLARGQPVDAIEALRTALQLDPREPGWHAALGSAYGGAGFPRDAVKSLRAALQLDPSMRQANSEMLQAMNFIPDLTPERIHEEHREWARRHASGARFRKHENGREPERRLRVGYLSADFKDPAVSFCLQPVLARHDQSGFEIFCYSDAAVEDPFSWRLRARNVAWRATGRLSDEHLAETIREDRIDLLVDLAGHSSGGRRVPVLARKPAPIQASWLGYPCTTGLDEMDYHFTDQYACPEGTERFFTERLVRLAGSHWCFQPAFDSPAAGSPPSGLQHPVTFGSLHALATLTPEVVALWARLLESVPGSKLIVVTGGADRPVVRALERFAAAGVEPGRVEVLADLSAESRLSLHGRIDINLDVFPCSGTVVALDSLWMGVPVVTKQGSASASRNAAAVLNIVGLQDLVAETEDRYVEIATALADDRERLAGLRAELRGRLERSDLMDAERFSRGLEIAYRRMWRIWCAGEPARQMAIEPAGSRRRNTAARHVIGAAGGIRPSRVLVDGVFFQYNNSGVARVWRSLMQEWIASGFAKNLVLLDRDGTAPEFSGVRRRLVAKHSYEKLAEDREMLQQVCDEEGAAVFASTYYSSPLVTPAVMLVYDMIPEVFGADLNEPTWREKEICIRGANRFVAISNNTARDLCSFYPEVDPGRVAVAHCGVDPLFRPAESGEVESFRARHGITRPYFLLVGTRTSYKNAATFFGAFARLRDRGRFAVVCAGGEADLQPELRALRPGSERYMLRLEDRELRLAYCGAIALVYPSAYEGFGMPVAEAMACGCPVITTPNASLPEVAGDAAIYVKTMDEAAMAIALIRILQPDLRSSLIALGRERARMFSWRKMAQIVERVLGEAAAETAMP